MAETRETPLLPTSEVKNEEDEDSNTEISAMAPIDSPIPAAVVTQEAKQQDLHSEKLTESQKDLEKLTKLVDETKKLAEQLSLKSNKSSPANESQSPSLQANLLDDITEINEPMPIIQLSEIGLRSKIQVTDLSDLTSSTSSLSSSSSEISVLSDEKSSSDGDSDSEEKSGASTPYSPLHPEIQNPELVPSFLEPQPVFTSQPSSVPKKSGRMGRSVSLRLGNDLKRPVVALRTVKEVDSRPETPKCDWEPKDLVIPQFISPESKPNQYQEETKKRGGIVRRHTFRDTFQKYEVLKNVKDNSPVKPLDENKFGKYTRNRARSVIVAKNTEFYDSIADTSSELDTKSIKSVQEKVEFQDESTAGQNHQDNQTLDDFETVESNQLTKINDKNLNTISSGKIFKTLSAYNLNTVSGNSTYSSHQVSDSNTGWSLSES